MSNKSTSTTTSTSTSYGYDNQEVFLKGSVVLCQHGFLGHEGTMNPLFENLKNYPLKGNFGAVFCNNLLKYSELSPTNSAVLEIKDKLTQNPEANVFVRTLFSNPKYGAVSTQARELKEMIQAIRKNHPNIPIVLVGYSKGGVVNCKCAIENEGMIDKIINIGTPHDDTLVQDIIQIIANGLKDKYGSILGIPVKPVQDVIQYLTDLINDGVDDVLNETVTYKNLKTEWNNMSVRPKFTPIAGEAIVVNGEFNGDFVVPTESAMATGFRGKTFADILTKFIVDDDKVTIATSQLRNAMGEYEFVLDILSAASEAILECDVVTIIETLFDIIANIVQNDADFSKCLKLAHISMLGSEDFLLTHETIGMRVFAGLNA